MALGSAISLIDGGAGDDEIGAYIARDRLTTPRIVAELYGGDGNDSIWLPAGSLELARISGGAGIDTLRLGYEAGTVRADLLLPTEAQSIERIEL